MLVDLKFWVIWEVLQSVNMIRVTTTGRNRPETTGFWLWSKTRGLMGLLCKMLFCAALQLWKWRIICRQSKKMTHVKSTLSTLKMCKWIFYQSFFICNISQLWKTKKGSHWKHVLLSSIYLVLIKQTNKCLQYSKILLISSLSVFYQKQTGWALASEPSWGAGRRLLAALHHNN